jgi:thioredoxin reductase
MTDTYRIGDEPLSEFFERIDWSFVKKVTITKTVDGIFWAGLTHYRSGKYMLHSFKHGRKAGEP